MEKPTSNENTGDGSPLTETAGSQISAEERNFRWAYALLVELAKVCLDKVNSEAELGAWPAQQEWDDLGPTSKSTFLRQAREMAGIPHDEFLEGIRSGAYDVDDLFDSANGRDVLDPVGWRACMQARRPEGPRPSIS